MRSRTPSPSMLVALLALFVALGGSSYAALQIPRGSVGTKQLKNSAVTSPKVKNNSLLVQDFKASQRARLQGPQGARGPQGAQGPQGPQGPVGPATGPAGGALAGNYPSPTLSPEGRGPAVAGVRVDANGQVLGWFNRRGGEPSVSGGHQGAPYEVTFPGSDFNIDVNAVPVATLVGSPGEVLLESIDGAISVVTLNSAGVPASANFSLVVFDASLTG